jgi:hypothetical protein
MPRSTRGSLKQQSTSSPREQQLLSSLSFYGAYHFEFWNRVVHIVFVPAIWWYVRVFAALCTIAACANFAQPPDCAPLSLTGLLRLRFMRRGRSTPLPGELQHAMRSVAKQS